MSAKAAQQQQLCKPYKKSFLNYYPHTLRLKCAAQAKTAKAKQPTKLQPCVTHTHTSQKERGRESATIVLCVLYMQRCHVCCLPALTNGLIFSLSSRPHCESDPATLPPSPCPCPCLSLVHCRVKLNMPPLGNF